MDENTVGDFVDAVKELIYRETSARALGDWRNPNEDDRIKALVESTLVAAVRKVMVDALTKEV